MRIKTPVVPLLIVLTAVVIQLVAAQAESGEAAIEPAADWTDCLACHPDYATDLPALSDLRPELLGNLTKTSCRDCHLELELQLVTNDWRHPTRPLAAHLACTDCHPAVEHSADNPPPVPTGEYNVDACYQCHSEVRLERGLISGHGETALTGCRLCHPAHEPLMAQLPVDLVPDEYRNQLRLSYDPYLSNQDCLWCHPSGLLLSNLQDGFVILNTMNLHERHVLDGRILCIECHEPHGSMQPGALRPVLLDGSLMSYTRRFSGGSCNTQCHGVAHTDWAYTNQGF